MYATTKVVVEVRAIDVHWNVLVVAGAILSVSSLAASASTSSTVRRLAAHAFSILAVPLRFGIVANCHALDSAVKGGNDAQVGDGIARSEGSSRERCVLSAALADCHCGAAPGGVAGGGSTAAEGHGARRRRRLDRSGVLGRSPALAKTPASSESKEKDADPTRHTVTHVTLEKKIGDLWGVTDNGAYELDVRLLPMPEPDLGADRDRLANGLASAEFVECP